MKAFIVSDVRAFMRTLLSDSLFHTWQLREAELNTLSFISIDGKVNMDYLTEEEKASRKIPYLTWEEAQPRIRSLIQGGNTPTYMSITLALDPSQYRGMPEGVLESLLLNIRYETVTPSEAEMEAAKASSNTISTRRLTLITGVSMKTFSLDKTPERMWDENIPKYFSAHGIPLTEA